MINTFLIIIIVNILKQTSIGLYIERPPKIDSTDYLHFYINNKDDQPVYEVVYKIESLLNTGEIYDLKICEDKYLNDFIKINNYLNSKSKNQKSEVDIREYKKIKEALEKNCVKDSYNSYISVDEGSRNLLYEQNISDNYKLCVFGLMYYEVEKSYYFAAQNGLLTQKGRIAKNFAFTDIKQLIGFFNESKNYNFRKAYRDDKTKRCSLEYQTSETNFNELRFTSSYFINHVKNDLSSIYIGYNFPNLITDPNVKARFLKKENLERAIISQNKANYFKKQIIKSTISWVERNTGIQQLIFNLVNTSEKIEEELKEEEITIRISKKIGCDNLTDDFLKESYVKFKIPKDDTSYNYNFIPVYCNEMLNKNNNQNYNFIQENDCQVLNNQLIYIKKIGEKFTFDKYLNEELHKTLTFDVFVLNWKFKMKNTFETIDFCGMEKSCDTIIDKKLKIIFLVCFQKERIIGGSKENEIMIEENFLGSTNFLLTQNEKADEDNSHGYMKSRTQLLNAAAMQDNEYKAREDKIKNLNKKIKKENPGTRYSGVGYSGHGSNSNNKPRYDIMAFQIISFIGMIIFAVGFFYVGVVILVIGIIVTIFLEIFTKTKTYEKSFLVKQAKDVKYIEENCFDIFQKFEDFQNFLNFSLDDEFLNDANKIGKNEDITHDNEYGVDKSFKVVKIINPINNPNLGAFHKEVVNLRHFVAEQIEFNAMLIKKNIADRFKKVLIKKPLIIPKKNLKKETDEFNKPLGLPDSSDNLIKKNKFALIQNKIKNIKRRKSKNSIKLNSAIRNIPKKVNEKIESSNLLIDISNEEKGSNDINIPLIKKNQSIDFLDKNIKKKKILTDDILDLGKSLSIEE